VRLPFFAHDPLETLIAIVDVGLQRLETACHFPTDTILNMLITLRFRHNDTVSTDKYSGSLDREHSPVQPELTKFGRAGVIKRARAWKIEDGKIFNTECLEICKARHLSSGYEGSSAAFSLRDRLLRRLACK
jgi:hypothetical protein